MNKMELSLMITLLKNTGGSMLMSEIYFEMRPKIKWLDGWVEGWADVIKQVKWSLRI